MRNKLKQTKKNQNANDHPPLAVGPYLTSVLSDHEDSNGPHGAGDVVFTAPPRLETKRTGCPENIKLAPIFSRKTQKRKSKESSDEELRHPVEKLSAVLPQSEQQLSTPTASLTERNEPWREQLSSSALHSCLKDIQESNPAFPVQRLFGVLQTKARKTFQDGGSTDNHFHSRNPARDTHKKEENASKRLRSSLTPEGTCGSNSLPPENVRTPVLLEKTHTRISRLNRMHRLKQKGAANRNVANHTKPDSSLQHCDILQRDSSSIEDVLWTDKYTPQCIGEVIGNGVSVQTLHSWLDKWKQRADSDGRRKPEENSSDAWDCGDFQGEDGSGDEGGELLRNTVLLTGPTGVGKTASVYACAQELGFQVFEVNCSARRDGRHVLHQLKEATQSHLVETSGNDPLKPAYFNNYGTGGFLQRNEYVLGRSVAPKNVSSHSKKLSTQTCVRLRHKGKTNPTSDTLANFFKTKAKADHLHEGVSPSEPPHASRSSESNQTATRKRKTATSLILFEEVDIVFEDDVGFHAAIKTFMTSTKRPVVLTTNDPLFRERFGCSLEEIVFTTPSTADVCSYLQLVCLAESVNLELDTGTELVTLTRGDIRRCLLQLQIWVNGSGRLPKEPSRLRVDSTHCSDTKILLHDAGCTASLLGLHPVTPNHLMTLFKSWTEPEVKKLLSLLAESWRRDVPLLYSNLELLLHIWTTETAVHSLKVTSSQPPSEMAASDATAINGNAVRNVHMLSRRENTASSYLTTRPRRGSLTDHETDKSAVDCLDALADFFDLMSYVDATVPTARPLVSGPCARDGFLWTGAEFKDSSLDEMRGEEEEEEEGRGQSQERLLELQAAVEGLGFHSCLGQVSETWSAAQKQDLGDTRTHRKGLSFSRQPLCSPSLSQRSYKLSRTVLSSLSFSLLGNRRAVCVDYLQILRCIIRSQRAQQRDKTDRRVNYLSSRQLGLSKSTMQLLADGSSKSSLKKSC